MKPIHRLRNRSILPIGNRHGTPSRARLRGLTLMEVLVVLLIVAVAMAVGLPLYLSSQKNAQQLTCQDNMAAIFQAEDAYRVQNRAYTSTVSTFSSTLGVPKCPCGTAGYIVTTSGSGSTLAITITCPNSGAHVTAKKMVTTDGVTFTFQ